MALETKVVGVPEDPIERIARSLGFKADKYYTAKERMIFRGTIGNLRT